MDNRPDPGFPQPPVEQPDMNALPAPAPEAPVVPKPTSGGGYLFGAGVFLAACVVTAIAFAVTRRKLRHASGYVIGSGVRDTLHIPTIAQRLHASRAGTRSSESGSDQEWTPLPAGGVLDTPNQQHTAGRDGWLDLIRTSDARETEEAGSGTHAAAIAYELPLGELTGQCVPVRILETGGLALQGHGADGVGRALILSTLSGDEDTGRPAGRVLLPAADALRLFGRSDLGDDTPEGLWIVPTLDHAVSALEHEISRRQHHQAQTHDAQWPVTMLVTRTPGTTASHRALLELIRAGRSWGITALVFGMWPTGRTLNLTTVLNTTTGEDEIVVTPPAGSLTEPLEGTNCYALPAADWFALASQLATMLDNPIDTSLAPPPSDGQNSQPEPDAPAERVQLAGAVAQPQQTDGTPEQGAAETAGRSVQTHNQNQLADDDPEPVLYAAPACTDESAASDIAEDASTPGTTAPGDASPGVLTLSLFGPPRAIWHPTPTTAGVQPAPVTVPLTPKFQEICTHLGVHANGATREAMAEAIWPRNNRRELPTNTLNTNFTRFKQRVNQATGGAIANPITIIGTGLCQLDTAHIRIDYRDFREALDRRHHTTDPDKVAQVYQEALNHYTGELGEGIYAEWIEPHRQDAKRDALDAACYLARHYADTDPQQALNVLEKARAIDPDNKSIYQHIIEIHHKLGQPDAADRAAELWEKQVEKGAAFDQ
ncbi:hypothetical protein GCM10023321_77610 [Pseudonocardia eucalypti]|uniref:Bacterial transcriptional activator domain-containing protein n=1 Tax=Pseudonocardia eucalypti TaxID=648755 RepID=A0ABP9RAV0_9PSEU